VVERPIAGDDGSGGKKWKPAVSWVAVLSKWRSSSVCHASMRNAIFGISLLRSAKSIEEAPRNEGNMSGSTIVANIVGGRLSRRR